MKNKNFRLYSHEEKRMWYDKAHILFEALEVDDSLYSDIMMSTGTMDATGKVEIYEGDILLYDDEEYMGGSLYAIVRFVHNGLYLAIDNGITNSLALGLSNYTVVGNKYENKGLEKRVYNQW